MLHFNSHLCIFQIFISPEFRFHPIIAQFIISSSFDADAVLRKAEQYFDIQDFENPDRALQTMREYLPSTAFTAFLKEKKGAYILDSNPKLILHVFILRIHQK